MGEDKSIDRKSLPKLRKSFQTCEIEDVDENLKVHCSKCMSSSFCSASILFNIFSSTVRTFFTLGGICGGLLTILFPEVDLSEDVGEPPTK